MSQSDFNFFWFDFKKSKDLSARLSKPYAVLAMVNQDYNKINPNLDFIGFEEYHKELTEYFKENTSRKLTAMYSVERKQTSDDPIVEVPISGLELKPDSNMNYCVTLSSSHIKEETLIKRTGDYLYSLEFDKELEGNIFLVFARNGVTVTTYILHKGTKEYVFPNPLNLIHPVHDHRFYVSTVLPDCKFWYCDLFQKDRHEYIIT